MAQLPQMFDAMQVKPATIGQQLPVCAEGYPVIITASEFKSTANDANQGYLDLTLQVIEGEFAGVQTHYRLNLYNNSEKAVEIAKGQLSAICHVTGVFQVADSAQLHNIPFRAVVGNQKLTAEQQEAKSRNEEVVPFTEVKGVLGYDGSVPGKPKNGANAPVQQQAAPTPPPAQQQAPVQPQQAAPWGNAAPQQEAQVPPAAASWSQNPAAATLAPPWAAK